MRTTLSPMDDSRDRQEGFDRHWLLLLLGKCAWKKVSVNHLQVVRRLDRELQLPP
jgi:hypothetical protein